MGFCACLGAFVEDTSLNCNEKINILGVSFDNVDLSQATQRGYEMVTGESFRYVVTPNPEFIMDAEKNEKFQQVLNGADLVIPDGIGVLYAAKILGTPLKSRVPGIDFASGVLKKMDEKGGGRLFLLGAKPSVAEEAGENIVKQYPNLVICGTQDGYFQDAAPVVAAIQAAQPDLLFVCLGAPKQEYFMAELGADTGAKLAIGLGGALDVFAGRVERAPEIWQKLGLEWAYRLKKEPWRFKRMARLPLILVKAFFARF